MCSVLKHMRRYRQFSHRLISNSFRNFSEEAELVSRAEQLATFKAARGRGGRGRGGRGPAAAKSKGRGRGRGRGRSGGRGRGKKREYSSTDGENDEATLHYSQDGQPNDAKTPAATPNDDLSKKMKRNPSKGDNEMKRDPSKDPKIKPDPSKDQSINPKGNGKKQIPPPEAAAALSKMLTKLQNEAGSSSDGAEASQARPVRKRKLADVQSAACEESPKPKSKPKAKTQPKRQAKADTKKAPPKEPDQSVPGRTEPSPKQPDQSVPAPKKPSAKKAPKKQSPKKAQESDAVSKKQSPKKAPEADAAEAMGNKRSTFSGRRRPTTPDPSARFDALAAAFVNIIRPKVPNPSTLEAGEFWDSSRCITCSACVVVSVDQQCLQGDFWTSAFDELRKTGVDPKKYRSIADKQALKFLSDNQYE